MKMRLFDYEFMNLWESTRGHYVNLLPVFKIFPRRKVWNDGIVSIHIGWLFWLCHLRLKLVTDSQ